jgi:hypothetical protein
MGRIITLDSGSRAPGTRKPSVFLARQIPGGFVEVRRQKTQQTINTSLPRAGRAFLAHCNP